MAVADLRVDPKNVRKHPERNIAAIVASIQDHGQVEPILIQTKTHRVIAGHGRLEALLRLGHKTAQVVELACDAKTAKILGIRLNKTAELGEWDFQGLSEILSSLNIEDQLRTGFADFEIEPLLNADWMPPAIEPEEFSRAEIDEAGAEVLTLKLNAEQTALFRKAQAANEQDDPLVFLLALCQSCLA